MSAINNIRRDLREASYLKYSPVPFAGAIHNFKTPLRKRFESRQYCFPRPEWLAAHPADDRMLGERRTPFG